jgi:hypothetical protein
MSEKALEARCGRYARTLGCLYWKLWPVVAGVPDRLVLIPGGVVWFVEFKTPNGRVRPVQRRILDMLIGMGFPVDVVRTYEDFQELLDNLTGDV